MELEFTPIFGLDRESCGLVVDHGQVDPFGHNDENKINKAMQILTKLDIQFQVAGHGRGTPNTHLLLSSSDYEKLQSSVTG